MENSHQTVLVTGATNGIGYEICKLFAKDKFKIVIVGPEPANLHNVSEVLKTLGASKVTTICRDLNSEKAAEEIFAETIKQQIRVDILINDCLYGLPGRFTEAAIEKDLQILHTNIISMVKLTKYFLKQMVQQNHGRILQLAILDDHTNSTFRTVYVATKAFIMSFTESLRNEISNNSGVLITSINGNALTGSSPNLVPSWPDEKEIDPAVLARLGYNALIRQASESESNSKGNAPRFAETDIIPLKTRKAS